MTNARLFISVGLPMILVLVGILLGQRNVGEINGRLDRMDQRMDKIVSSGSH